MSRLGRERLVRAGLVSVLLVGVLAATFGAGHRSSEAVLDAASAFLQRGPKVQRVSAVTGEADAEAAVSWPPATSGWRWWRSPSAWCTC